MRKYVRLFVALIKLIKNLNFACELKSFILVCRASHLICFFFFVLMTASHILDSGIVRWLTMWSKSSSNSEFTFIQKHGNKKIFFGYVPGSRAYKLVYKNLNLSFCCCHSLCPNIIYFLIYLISLKLDTSIASLFFIFICKFGRRFNRQTSLDKIYKFIRAP